MHIQHLHNPVCTSSSDAAHELFFKLSANSSTRCGQLETTVGVLMKSSLSIFSPLPTLALLVGSISLYRRRAINTCQLTQTLRARGKVVPLTWLWFTKFAHGRTCAIKAEYLLFLAATPCMYGVKPLCPYSGSPFLTLSTISRISISTSLLFSVQP